MLAASAVIGIDVGTSGTKAILVASDGSVISERLVPYRFDDPAPGWAEQHAAVWWHAAVEAIRGLLDDLQQRQVPTIVEAVSLTGQMHGLVPLAVDGSLLRPAIMWCDLRSVAQATELESALGRSQVCEWTQNPPLPNFTLTKLLWMKAHEPDLFSRIGKFLLPKDYVRYCLTDVLATEVSDASGTLLFDVAKRRWSVEMCQAAGIPQSWLPEVVESGDRVGSITARASEATGLPVGTPVIAGAGDQAAGALGIGVIHPGQLSVSLGTSGVVLAPTNHPVRDARGALHTFCHAVPDAWYVMGVTQAAGGSLKWYRDRLFPGLSYDSILNNAQVIAPGSEGLLYLPYLMGERSPHLDPLARAAWVGLQWQHTAAHMARAVLEGVAFSLNDCWRLIQALGLESRAIKLTGGGADGELWVDILAAVFKQSVSVVRGSQGPAFGAAILAAKGAGIISFDALTEWLPETVPTDARTDWIDRYSDLFLLYQEAYRQLRGLYVSIDHWTLKQ